MINDVFYSVDLLIVCYADDSTVVARARAVEELMSRVNNALREISSWMISNKLKLNAQNTKYSCFTNKRSLVIPDPILGNVNISRAQTFKILGLHLDENLKFANHIKSVRSKLSFSSHIMSKAKSNTSLQNRILLYNAFVKPMITYGLILWGFTNQKYLDKIQKLQNRIVKNMSLGASSIDDKYKKMGLMTMEQLRIYEYCKFMHRTVHGKAPSNIGELFTQSVPHRYPTRSNHMRLPAIKLASSKSVSFKGPKEWNKIPATIRDLPHSTFGRHIKEYILTV